MFLFAATSQGHLFKSRNGESWIIEPDGRDYLASFLLALNAAQRLAEKDLVEHKARLQFDRLSGAFDRSLEVLRPQTRDRQKLVMPVNSPTDGPVRQR